MYDFQTRESLKSEGKTIVLLDRPEHILEWITFYDIDSNLIDKRLTVREKKLYLIEIKKDITYFRKGLRDGIHTFQKIYNRFGMRVIHMTLPRLHS